ncbi:MAG TPA: hypothetical protein VGM94_14325 [Galbitalea sp.]|jgi:hypothetical protein
MRIHKRVWLLAAIVAALALASFPQAANAASKKWGVLKISVGGTYRGFADGTASTTTVNLKNTSRYSGTAYMPSRVETEWYFHDEVQDPDGVYHTSWTYHDRGDTPVAKSMATHIATVQIKLRNDASSARAEPRICLPKPWGVPVPCSGTSILTMSY